MKPTSFRGAGLQRLRHETDDFRHKIQVDALALADATHAVGALSVVSEHHVFADGDDGTRRGALLDVDASCVDLIKEREPDDRGEMRQNRSGKNPQQTHSASARGTHLLNMGMPH